MGHHLSYALCDVGRMQTGPVAFVVSFILLALVMLVSYHKANAVRNARAEQRVLSSNADGTLMPSRRRLRLLP